MKLRFKNTYSDNYINEINFTVNKMGKDGWYPFDLEVMSGDGELLMGVNQSFSPECLSVFVNKLSLIIDNKERCVEFEPLEPSFTLTLNKLNDDLIKLLLVIDMEFVRKGKATQTGMGVLIHIDRENLKWNIEMLKAKRG